MSRALVTAAGMRIIRVLVGNKPHTMAQLVEITGVTRTAVTEQLNELVSAGFVERSLQRVGRGRPRHLFEATDAALTLLFENNQNLLGPAFLKALVEIAGHDVALKVMRRAAQDMAQHYNRQIAAQDPRQRMLEMAEILRREGVLVEVDQNEQTWQMRQRTCPFVDMIEDTRTVCDIECDLLSSVIRAPVELVGCRLDGCPGCSFQLSSL
jgi:predicted ArsR family transcriptional regulator